jgi:uncharacterized protein YndB with AHSA1/START domain
MEVTITREFEAPRQLVYEAWTDPQHLAQWFGPQHFTIPYCEVDPRPGGAFLVHMQAPDGTVHPSKGMFEEVVPPERLVFTTSAFEDDAGEPLLAARHTATFEESGGKTRMTLHAVVIRATPETAEALAGMEQGWSESFDKLEAHLASVR